VADHVFADAAKAGVLVRLFPGVYAAAHLADDIRVRRRAALLYLPDTALSHVDALAVSGLLSAVPDGDADIHLTGSWTRPAVRASGVRLHRRIGFVADLPFAVVRDGLRVVRMEQAIVESWPLLPEIDRRVPAIVAVRDRLTLPGRLLATLAANRGTTGSAEMRHLFGLLAEGCHSQLEIWGHQNVFTHPSLPASRGQVQIRLGSKTVYLDRAFDAEMVDAELDGAAYHGNEGQRERDLQRDIALARLGWQTVRFSHQRLFGDPDGVRAELLDILATRRRQLGVRGA
jgi:very-short-patch-repair endonuclease